MIEWDKRKQRPEVVSPGADAGGRARPRTICAAKGPGGQGCKPAAERSGTERDGGAICRNRTVVRR